MPDTALIETKTAPHERFWQAGQTLFQALQRCDEEARDRLASAWQEQQQSLWKLQLDAQRRAEELRLEYGSALRDATGDDAGRVYEEATRKYQDALAEIQAKSWKEWEAAGAGHQRFLANLQAVIHTSRLAAFRDYKHACRQIWSEADPDTLSCEDIATIGQSLMLGAQLMGGRPHGS